MMNLMRKMLKVNMKMKKSLMLRSNMKMEMMREILKKVMKILMMEVKETGKMKKESIN